MELGWERYRRVKYLEDEQSALAKTKGPWDGILPRTETINFKGELTSLPVIRVPIGLPKYSLSNIRTKSSQISYLRGKTLPESFFEDNEFIDAQKVQHLILKKFISKGVNLLAYFKRTEQEIPLILTPLGIVVNGNRRLCAWRELNLSGEKSMDYIDVIVLPSNDEQAIRKLEYQLQLVKDIKQDYDWCSEALSIRNDFEFMTYDQLEKFYNDKTRKDLLFKMECLNQAESYLESIDDPLNYDIVVGDEFFFQKLIELRAKFNNDNPDKRDTFTSLSYIALENKNITSNSGRMWDYINDIYKNFDILVDELENQHHISKMGKNNEPLLGPLGELFGHNNPLDGVAAGLLKCSNKEEIAQTIEDTISIQKEFTKKIDESEKTRKYLTKSKNLLQRSFEAMNYSSNLDGVFEMLNEMENILNKFKKEIISDAKH